MKTDALSYRLLSELPEAFFELIGRSPAEAKQYRFSALEIKDTAVRLDGFYEPVPPNENKPVYFVEYQNQKYDRVYSNVMLKIALYLEKKNPRQDWHAVIMYPTRSVEQDNLQPYRGFLAQEQVTRIYLDDLPDPPPGHFGVSLLKMMAAKPGEVVAKARQLIPQVRASAMSVDSRKKLVELIETIVLYQFPEMSRKEFEKMLQVNDIRETRIFKEAKEEGKVEGKEEGKVEGKEEGKVEGKEELQEKLVQRLLAKKYTVEEIAELTGFSLPQIKKLKKRLGR